MNIDITRSRLLAFRLQAAAESTDSLSKWLKETGWRDFEDFKALGGNATEIIKDAEKISSDYESLRSRIKDLATRGMDLHDQLLDERRKQEIANAGTDRSEDVTGGMGGEPSPPGRGGDEPFTSDSGGFVGVRSEGEQPSEPDEPGDGGKAP